jgi:uncharacterized protein YndB with AHSA1/START domain
MSDFGVVIEPRTVRFERLLAGPIERVWSYLTDPEKRGTWLAAGPIEPRIGGQVELVFHNSELTADDDPPPPKYAQYAGESRMRGRVTACDPPRLLAYTWSESSGEDSEVTFELSPRGGEVLLVLTHRRLATRADLLGVAGGWHTHLGILADRLAGRTPSRFWATLTRVEAEYDRRITAD